MRVVGFQRSGSLDTESTAMTSVAADGKHISVLTQRERICSARVRRVLGYDSEWFNVYDAKVR